MNLRHLKWAAGHDWGRQAFLKEGKLLIANNGEPTGGFATVRGAWLEFSSFNDLAAWAGY
tara:strand:- start:112 stop:291 length:180 start_codon:yes stop_codon:yes gene_type:complete